MIRKLASASAFALVLSLLIVSDAAAGCVPSWRDGGPFLPAFPSGTTSSATADFDHDGRSDLAVATAGTVYVSLNADGELVSPVQIGTGNGFDDLQAGDVNGDGDADLVLSETGLNAIVVYPGHGDGTFGSRIQTNVAVTPKELVIGDFNGDGKIDVGFSTLTTVDVWLADGTGAFTNGGLDRSANSNLKYLTAADVNGDGKLDLIGHVGGTATLHLYAGNGNGTVASPVDRTGRANATGLVAGDLDDDGDVDLVELSEIRNLLAVLINTGGGTFAAPVTYGGQGTVTSFILAEVNGDGLLDMVASTTQKRIATFPGNGDGTFAALTLSVSRIDDYAFAAERMLAADVDGDGGSDDLIVGESYSPSASYYAPVPNGCGAVDFFHSLDHPVISPGQTVTVNVAVRAYEYTFPILPDPTGEVTLYDGDTVLSTATLVSNAASFTISDLAAGTHELHVRYGGDDNFVEQDSRSFTVEVVPYTTSATLEGPATVAYNTYLELTGVVTASDGQTPTGMVMVYEDGVELFSASASPVFSALFMPETLGEHTYHVRYTGNSTHPPSELSEPVTVTVEKAPTSISVHAPGVAMAGEAFNVQVFAEPAPALVSLYDGTSLIAELTTDSSGQALFTNVSLSAGSHLLKATRAATETHAGAEATQTVKVFPAASGAAIDVRATGGVVTVAWVVSPSLSAASVSIAQWFPDSGWVANPNAVRSNPYEVPFPVPGALYAFRLVARDAAGKDLAASIDAAVLTTFTGDPLVKGTAIKAAHVTELAAAINTWRSAVALTPISIPNAAPGKTIRASDINALNNGMNAARAATGMSVLTLPVLQKGGKIRAVDLQQLRDLLVR